MQQLLKMSFQNVSRKAYLHIVKNVFSLKLKLKKKLSHFLRQHKVERRRFIKVSFHIFEMML